MSRATAAVASWGRSAATAVRHPVRSLDEVTGTGPLYPLLILFGLNAVDELDRTAFGILLPEIRDDFGLDLTGVLVVVATVLAVALALQVPIAQWADHRPRVPIALGGAVVWSVFSVMTGLVSTVLLLGVARAGSGIGKAVVDPTHNSLLADYYAPDHRPGVYSFHRAANAVGQFLGPLLGGLLAFWWGWRAPFFVFAVPGLILVVLGLRMREPVRGRWEREAMGASEETLDTEEAPASFAEAWRTCWKINSLRRIWYALPFLAASLIGFVTLAALFYEEEFGLNEIERGTVAACVEPLQLVGLIIGARMAAKWVLTEPGRILRFLCAIAIAASVLAAVFALSPSLVVAVGANALITALLAVVLPGILVALSLAIPPRTRSLGFSIASLWVLPGLVVLPLVGAIGDAWGIRLGMLVMTPVFLLGGLIIASAGDLIGDDIRQVWRVAAARSEDLYERNHGNPRILIVRELEVGYDDVQVLFGVDMEIREGEIVALLGTNGAGKSTLLRSICGIVEADRGAVVFDGIDVTHAPPYEIAARGVVQVPGGAGVFPSLTVDENLRLAGWLRRDDPHGADADRQRAIDTFPMLATRRHEPAGDLSGGQQQMLALGMALVARPKLLMIDELSLGLAPVVVERLLPLVRELRDAGSTVVLVEQSVNLALNVADRAYFMEKGEIRFEGPAADLLDRPDLLRSVFLEGAAAVTGGPGSGSNGRIAARLAPEGGDGDEPVTEALRVEGLSRAFGGVMAVDGVTLSARPGEIVGIIGPNGAGKTTLFDLISGFVPADRGTVHLGELDISHASVAQRAWRGLGRSFQDARLFPGLTVEETLSVALERWIEVRDPINPALRLPGAFDSEEHVRQRVEELIELFGLEGFRSRFVRELSTGSRRVVDLACVAAHRPTVVLLDEPSSGIAQRETEALGPLLERLRDGLGAALVVVEHDVPLVTRVADRIVAMDQGAVIADGAPDEVLRDDAVVASYLGSDRHAIRAVGFVTGGSELMQPSSDRPSGAGSSRSLRRWGPIVAIVAVVAVIAAVVVFTSGGDDDDGGDAAGDPAATDGVGDEALSFSEAEEQGIEVDWPETCDTETGNLALPNAFAPECYAPFEGDNGGETDVGVTADTITVAYYQSPPNPITDFILGGFGITDTNEESQETIEGYVDLFNEYYETYGRTVEVVPIEGSGPPNDDVAARADAVRVDEEIGAFMVWGGPILTDAFADELAARGIPCIGCQLGEPDQFNAERAPYIVNIGQSPDQARAHLVEWLSKQVAGRTADFAGEDLQGEERVFGTLFLESDEDAAEQNQETLDALADEGVEVAESIPYQLDPARLQEQAAGAIARFKDAGVTSIIFSGDPVAPGTFTIEATNQDYFPEWIITGSALVDTTAAARSFDQEQWSHAFGISPLSARLNPENSGSFYLWTWAYGTEPPAPDTTGVLLPLPQVLFAGVQATGPNLTRENWTAALLSLDATPNLISQPSLDWGEVDGWPNTDYHGLDNWTQIWWDAEATGPSEIRRVDQGMYQYVDGGQRYFLGEWPEEDTRAFDPEGAVDFYEEPPEGEAPPDYPSPAG